MSAQFSSVVASVTGGAVLAPVASPTSPDQDDALSVIGAPSESGSKRVTSTVPHVPAKKITIPREFTELFRSGVANLTLTPELLSSLVSGQSRCVPVVDLTAPPEPLPSLEVYSSHLMRLARLHADSLSASEQFRAAHDFFSSFVSTTLPSARALYSRSNSQRVLDMFGVEDDAAPFFALHPLPQDPVGWLYYAQSLMREAKRYAEHLADARNDFADSANFHDNFLADTLPRARALYVVSKGTLTLDILGVERPVSTPLPCWPLAP